METEELIQETYAALEDCIEEDPDTGFLIDVDRIGMMAILRTFAHRLTTKE